MCSRVERLVSAWGRWQEPDTDQGDQLAQACAWLTTATQEEVLLLLDHLRQQIASPPGLSEAQIDPVLAQFVARQCSGGGVIETATRSRILLLYNELGATHDCRWRLLQWLAAAAGTEDLRAFARLVGEDPPRDGQGITVAFAPLFQRTDYDPATLFPALLGAIQHLPVAAPVLDLCNYLVDQSLVAEHPAAARAAELTQLLGKLVQQLARLDESAGASRESPEALSRRVDECVALIVGLCYALALIGEEAAVGKLYQAMELGHRRIRTEAAAALARFGQSAGIDALVALAAEPVSRLRVLAHAEELGIADRIDEQYTGPAARAEAEVALELAQPAHFGIPPAALELIDSRTLYWPGYEAPILCHLFRYSYRFESAQYSNVAIAGPAVHAFVADLNDLPPDDIYAAYAGWDAEHEDIYEIPMDRLSADQRMEVERLQRRLSDHGYEAIQCTCLGHFLGQRMLVAQAIREEMAGTAVVDQECIEWYPVRTIRHSLGPREAYCIYKGRRLLRSFND